MLKKDTLGQASAKSLDEAFKCGECLHFKNTAHPSFKEPCKKLGVRAFAVAPRCFTPNVTEIAQNSDQFVALASLLTNYSSKQKRILLGLLRTKSGKSKMAFGTKVYFHAFGKDYISNYLSGYFIGYTSSGDLIICGSPDQKSRGRSYVAYFKDTSALLTHADWKKKRNELREKHRIVDPASDMVIKSSLTDYEPPTLDSAPASWHDKQETKRRKGKKELTFKVS